MQLILAFLLSLSALAQERTPVTLQTGTISGHDVEIRLEPRGQSEIDRYSYERINQDQRLKEMLLKLRKNFRESGVGQRSTEAVNQLFRSTRHFVAREVPAEVLAFYTAQFLTHLRHLAAKAPWEIEDPATIKAFVDHLFTPSGYIGFAGFMAASRISAVPFIQILKLVERDAQLHPGSRIRTRMAQGTAKVIRKLLLPAVTMGAGIAVSSIIQEFWFDPNVSKCSELTNMRNRTQRQENQMIDACQMAYESWTASNKMWEWTPHLVSLMVSAQISQSLVTMVGAGINGARFQMVRRGGSMRKVFISTLRGINVFFGKGGAVFKTTPLSAALTFGAQKVIQLYLFLETAKVFDHFIVRPWHTRRLSGRVLDTLSRVEMEYLDAIDETPAINDQGCRSGTMGDIIANFFTESCHFGDKDILSVMKKFSHQVTEYRNYALEPFLMAARGWNHYVSEFVTVGTGSAQVYATLGPVLQEEFQMIQNGEGKFGTTDLTEPDFLNGFGGYSLDEQYEELVARLPEAQKAALNFAASERAQLRGSNDFEKIKNLVESALPRARFDNWRPSLERIMYPYALIPYLLSAADRSKDVNRLKIVKLYKDKGLIADDITDNYLRYQLVTDGLRALRYVLGQRKHHLYAEGFIPLVQFEKTPLGLIDALGRPTEKWQNQMDRPNKEHAAYFEMWQALGEPLPLEPGETLLFYLGLYTETDAAKDLYPKNWGQIDTPSLVEYVVAGMACGPKFSRTDLFQRRSSWGEWFFNWYESGNEEFLKRYNAAIAEGDIAKAYEVVNEFKFSDDYSIAGNIITTAFGMKEMFLPPRVAEYPPGFMGGVSGPAVVNYTPCNFSGQTENIRGHEKFQIDHNAREKRYGLLDILRHQLADRFKSDPEAITEWWEAEVSAGFNAHLKWLKRRYRAIVDEHFVKTFNKKGYFQRVDGAMHNLSESSFNRLAQNSEVFRSVVPKGVGRSLEYELEFFSRVLTRLSESLAREKNNPAIESAAKERIRAMQVSLKETVVLVGLPAGEAGVDAKMKEMRESLLFLIGLFSGEDDPVDTAESLVMEVDPSPHLLSGVLDDYTETNNYKDQVLHFVLKRMFGITMEISYYQDLTLAFAN